MCPHFLYCIISGLVESCFLEAFYLCLFLILGACVFPFLWLVILNKASTGGSMPVIVPLSVFTELIETGQLAFVSSAKALSGQF